MTTESAKNLSRPEPFILIAYMFPPYKKVGAHRWRKLTKYLARLGHDIHVVTVNWRENVDFSHLDDLDAPNIHIHRIPSGYPHNLKYKDFGNKYLNFLKSLPFRLFLDRFIFFDDEAQNWGKYLIPFVRNLSKSQNIKTIIATGSPFQSNYLAAKIKASQPHLKLIQDYRDVWVDNPYLSFSEKQLEKVKFYQQFSIEQADHIVCISEGLQKSFAGGKAHYHVIENGVDGEDIHSLLQGTLEKRPSSLRKTLTHIGSITNGREKPLFALLDALIQSSKLRETIQIKLIGTLPLKASIKLKQKYEQLFQDETLVLLPGMPQLEAFSHLKTSDYALQLTSPDLSYALSTKIYEYGLLEVPTISLNYGDSIDHFLKQKPIGHSLNLYKTDDLEHKILNIITEDHKEFDFSIAQNFTHQKLAEDYSRLINS